MPTRRVFVTYHHADQAEVGSFIDSFDVEFHEMRAIGVSDEDDFIDSSDTDYVLRRIREKYITGTSARYRISFCINRWSNEISWWN